MAGRISELADPDHLAQLLERHEVSVPVEPGTDEHTRLAATDACYAMAQAWCEAEGVEVTVYRFDTTVEPDAYVPEPCVGVWWDVVVGKAVVPPGPPTGLEWKWSARMLHWHGWFASMAAKADADAKAAERRDRVDATVVPMSAFRGSPPWDRHRDGGEA